MYTGNRVTDIHKTYTHGTHGYGRIGGSGPDRPIGLCLASSGLGREVRSDCASTSPPPARIPGITGMLGLVDADRARRARGRSDGEAPRCRPSSAGRANDFARLQMHGDRRPPSRRVSRHSSRRAAMFDLRAETPLLVCHSPSPPPRNLRARQPEHSVILRNIHGRSGVRGRARGLGLIAQGAGGFQ